MEFKSRIQTFDGTSKDDLSLKKNQVVTIHLSVSTPIDDVTTTRVLYFRLSHNNVKFGEEVMLRLTSTVEAKSLEKAETKEEEKSMFDIM